MVDKPTKETTPVEPKDKTLEVMEQMQAMMSEQQKTITELKAQVAQSRNQASEPEVVDLNRKPAGNILIATIDGMPITDMKLEKKTMLNGAGQTVVTGFDAICKVHGIDKPVKITYGDMDNPKDYLNLPRTRFDLVDQVEESGASQVDRGRVVRNDGLVDEKKEVNNVLITTGRKVQLAIREDFRYYTIEVNGEKVTLPQDKIYR